MDWAGYAKLVEEGGGLKFAFYQVYLVSFVIFLVLCFILFCGEELERNGFDFK